jgi:hexose oxidase
VNSNGRITLNHVTHRSAPPSQDLYWAHTGGGGGNYGVITRYEFATLPKAPRFAELFIIGWSWANTIIPGGVGYLVRIINAFEHLTRTMPPPFFGMLKLAHKDAGAISLVVQYTHDGVPGWSTIRPELKRALKQHGIDDCAEVSSGRIVGHPVNLSCPMPYQALTWWQVVQTLSGSGPNQKGKYKSAYMRDGFAIDQIQTIYKYLTLGSSDLGKHVDLSQSLLQIDSYGGQINSIAPYVTAVWQRSSIFKLQYQTYWKDAESGPSTKGDAHLRWIREFYSEMYDAYGGVPDPSRDPTNNVDGCYINYPDIDLNDRGGRTKALSLYYGGNLPRLMRVKREWDPLNYFQNGQSIPLP